MLLEGPHAFWCCGAMKAANGDWKRPSARRSSAAALRVDGVRDGFFRPRDAYRAGQRAAGCRCGDDRRAILRIPRRLGRPRLSGAIALRERMRTPFTIDGNDAPLAGCSSPIIITIATGER